jgi:hypothetical protein
MSFRPTHLWNAAKTNSTRYRDPLQSDPRGWPAMAAGLLTTAGLGRDKGGELRAPIR